jgi:hypothetical protein
MPTYTVHAPPSPNGAADPQRFAFVRDGFHVWAFLSGPLWFIAHRLWLALLGYIVAVAAMSAVLLVFVGSEGVRFVVGVLFAVLVGLEAPSLRRWTYARNGWRNVGIVVGGDGEEAERRFFQQWSAATPVTTVASPPPSAVPPPAAPPHSGDHGIIGLFPEPGARR